MSENYQYIPFNISEHLACFLSSKLSASLEVLQIKNAKAVNVNRRSFLGKMIASNITKTNTPAHKVKNAAYYLKVPVNIGKNDRAVIDLSRSFGKIEDSAHKMIVSYLEEMFRTELVSFVRGAQFGQYQNKGTTKGLTHDAIKEFMLKYQIPFTSSSFSNLVKKFDRCKKSPKPLPLLTS